MKLQGIKLIVGLGNPDKEYGKTYHNAGILFVDYLINQLAANIKRPTTYKNFEYIKVGDLVIVKPTTFMNESGKSVLEAIKFFKIKPEEILVAHDDSDIELEKYKIDFNRTSAGHNGVESIINHLKTQKFWRLRIGIRKPENKKRLKAVEFVLKKISKKDLDSLKNIFEIIFKNEMSCKKA